MILAVLSAQVFFPKRTFPLNHGVLTLKLLDFDSSIDRLGPVFVDGRVTTHAYNGVLSKATRVKLPRATRDLVLRSD